MMSSKWHWTEIPESGGASGGLASKVFRGIDELNGEDLLAREVIQNSWDASRKLNQGKAKNSKVPFRMQFKFVNLVGKARDEFIENSGIKEIYEQSKLMQRTESERAKIEFDKILKGKSLQVLICSDFGAHGLYGAINLKSESILFRALYMFGDTKKEEDAGAGGSYGFGKSAFIRGSGIQTVFAYSSFMPFNGDKVTRRFVGTSYWGSHRTIDKKDLEGRAIFGDPKQSKPFIPFEDTHADELASKLGMEIRTAKNETQIGTSLLLVQPQVTPQSLLYAIEKWWWPAIIDDEMEIVVIDENGSELHPRPKSNSFVAPYLRPYEVLSERSTISAVLGEKIISSGWQSVGGVNLGKALLRVAKEEELQAELEGGGDRFPKIALMRSPKMVIEYKDYPRGRIAVRGVFIADNQADFHLKNTEPAQHSHWDEKPSREIPELSTRVAQGVQDRLRTGLREFINEVDPPTPNDRETLSVYSDLMKGFLSGKKVGPPPPPPVGKMPIEIHFSQQPEPKAHKSQVFTEAKFKVSIADNSEDSEYVLRITADFRILENEGDSGDIWPCHVDLVKSNKAFVVVSNNELQGKITKGEVIEISVKSDLYDSQWTSRLKPQVQIVENELKKVASK